jgi:hypothetical protein
MNTEAFLGRLFPVWPDNVFAEIRAIHGGDVAQSWHRSVAEIMERAAILKATHDVFFSVGARRGRNGTGDEVAYVTTLWGDIDVPLLEAQRRLAAFEHPPSAIVASGHGAHPYWFLREPYMIESEGDRRRVESMNKGLAQALGGDKCWDLPRVLRVPDTLNHKDRTPVPVTLVCFDPLIHYDLADFEAYAVQSDIPEASPAIFTGVTPEAETVLQKAIDAGISAETRHMISEGFVPEGWTSRSERDMSVVSRLIKDASLSDDEIRSLFLTYPVGDRYREEGDGDRYLALTIGKARSCQSPMSIPHRLPVIVADNRQLRDVSDQALAAVAAANDPPAVFVRGGLPVRLTPDELGRVHVEPLGHAAMCGVLARAADWTTSRGREVPPPKAVVEDVRSLGDWPDIPPLRGLVEGPVLVPGKRLITEPGYDSKSGLYYTGPALELPPIDATVEGRQSARALLLDDLLGDFAFADQSSRANAVALLLLPFVRRVIPGPTPLHVFTSPTPGTGKGLLADACVGVGVGAAPDILTVGRDEAEWNKQITSRLLAGRPAVLIDNLEGRLDSAVLSAALTRYPTWDDRLLGGNAMANLPCDLIWIATGNNVTLSAEMVRRCVMIRLDSRTERPWLRTRFRHRDLPGWARKQRPALAGAALTLVQAWLDAGEPAYIGKLPGSFERWAAVLGGILQTAGINGFLDNATELYEQLDPEHEEWLSFVECWFAQHRGEAVCVAELYAVAAVNNLLDEVVTPRHRGEGMQAARVRLGKALAKRADRVFGKYQIKRGKTVHGQATWMLAETEG